MISTELNFFQNEILEFLHLRLLFPYLFLIDIILNSNTSFLFDIICKVHQIFVPVIQIFPFLFHFAGRTAFFHKVDDQIFLFIYLFLTLFLNLGNRFDFRLVLRL